MLKLVLTSNLKQKDSPMPKLNFELPAPITTDEAYSKIKNFLNSDNAFKKMDSKLSTTFDESSKKCSLKGAQFSASLQVKPKDDQCLVAIEVEIPFALTLFKGKIKEEVEKAFKKVLT